MNIPEEVTEAAARAVYELDPWENGASVTAPPVLWNDLSEGDRNNYYPVARAALEAAAPLLMAQAWDEGKDAVWLDENESRYFLTYDTNPYRKEQS